MQTESHLADLATGGTASAKTATTSQGTDPHHQQSLEAQRLNLEAQKTELEARKTQLEKDLERKQLELDEMFTASSEQFELQKRRLSEREKEYKKENEVVMESVSMQTDYIEQLEHKQVNGTVEGNLWLK